MNTDASALQENAAVVFRNLSVNAENDDKLVWEGGLPALVALLGSRNESIVEHVAGAVRNLSCGVANRAKMAEGDGVRLLVTLLSSTNDQVPSTPNPQP
jgi:hypothetical protein